jgi:predicted nucleic acid-binding protein
MNGINIFSDTNPLIYLLNGNFDIANILDGKVVWLSVISELELFGKKGLSNSDIEQINALLDNCFIVDINPDVKKLTKHLLQQYRIKLPDAIIAATSMYLGFPFLTSDTAFQKIPDLSLIQFET